MATNAEVVAFIKTLGNLAVNECNNRAAQGLPFVLPSICIAQSAHETGWGTAPIMTRANAFFGIKAGGSWTGKVYTADTWEVVDGAVHNITANFRAYDSLQDSVRDYYDLITGNSRYAAGLSTLEKRLTPYETIYAIWSGGYATDPPYVQMIMDIVNGRDLDQWDDKVTGIATGEEYDYTSPPISDGTAVDGTLVKYVFEKIT